MSERRELNMEQLEDVTGGLLSVVSESDGCYVLLRDDNHNVIESYKIKTKGSTVSNLMKQLYWSFDDGQRDDQMLAYLKANGHI